MSKHLCVDRIINEIAVCECDDKSMIEIKLSLLPANVKEGDFIVCVNGKYIIDAEETRKRRERNLSKMQSLLERTRKKRENME